MKDLTGRKFGRWAVKEFAYRNKSHYYWHCECKCGNLRIIEVSTLKNKRTTSCGCYKNEMTIKRQTIHGMCNTPEYHAWEAMIQRCTNSNHPQYNDYGGRGIKVCDRWLIFENFYEDMGERPSSDYSIERIDNDKDYKLENCKWALDTEQNNNRRKYSPRRK